jgi:hypothetical protein
MRISLSAARRLTIITLLWLRAGLQRVEPSHGFDTFSGAGSPGGTAGCGSGYKQPQKPRFRSGHAYVQRLAPNWLPTLRVRNAMYTFHA